MNKCPKCKNTPITFSEWNKGLNAFKFSCTSCKINLKGKAVNFILLVFTVLSAIVTLIVAHQVFDFTFARKGVVFFALMLPSILVGSSLGYYFGGYRCEVEGKS